MNEERHEITYSPTFTERLSRSSINRIAGLDSHGYPGMGARIAACREWLEANPQGMTREEFNKLPDGTIIATALGNQYILAGGRGLYTTLDRAGQTVRWVEFGDDDLAAMTVVSTPAPPPLEKVHIVRDCGGAIWERWRYRPGFWSMTNSAVITERDLIENYGPITPLIPGPQIGGEA